MCHLVLVSPAGGCKQCAAVDAWKPIQLMVSGLWNAEDVAGVQVGLG